MSLHASTQTDNRTAEKVRWLYEKGFSRVVLARELSVEEIRAIHEAVPKVELEVFVHGALCVSYSGLCYASHHCMGRSANRGECAQVCRLKYDLKDSAGRTWVRQRHCLSLKDLCRIDALEELLEAGASSLKIEGRLKDEVYVKNVVAAYSEQLNKIIARHPGRYRRASRGRCSYSFEPNLSKTFNRGFTHYFLHGRQPGMGSPDTPKAMGEYVGKVKEMSRGGAPWLTVAGIASFSNGDGLCFINDERQLEGFRVNRAVAGRLFPLRMPQGLRPGMALYRNNDQEFERLLSGRSAERKMEVEMVLDTTADGFALTMVDAETGEPWATAEAAFDKQEAQKPQRDNMVSQLSRLGGTPFVCRQVDIRNEADRWFVPSSVLSKLRQEAVEGSHEFLEGAGVRSFVGAWVRGCVGTRIASSAPVISRTPVPPHPRTPDTSRTPEDGGPRDGGGKSEASLAAWYSLYQRPYMLNVANSQARAFYEREGLSEVAPAFELGGGKSSQVEPLLMQCRYCLRYELGYCLKHGGKPAPWSEPLFLEMADGRQLRLEFDCRRCQMNVYGKRAGSKE